MFLGTYIFLLIYWGINSNISAAKLPTAAEVLATAKDSDWRVVEQENLLYMTIPQGQVIIELVQDFSRQHVSNIKTLAQEKYWDGLAILRSQDNYVVQWGDPLAEKEGARPIKNGKKTLPAEFEQVLDKKIPFNLHKDKDVYAPEVGFSRGMPVARDVKAKKMWLLHCYGMVGAGRNNDKDSGGGPELYVVTGHAPRHLDRNVTLVGRVLQGMEWMSSLPRGTGALGFYEKPQESIPLKLLKWGGDVPLKERVNLEVLRTDTFLFTKWTQARQNRREEWFHYSAGHIDICNIPIPVRQKN